MFLITQTQEVSLDSLRYQALRIQLAAAGIGSSFLLLYVPNVETLTLLAFFFGFMFHFRYAISITFVMAIGWEILISTVLGFSGPTFFFKILAWSLITLLGSMSRKIKITKVYEFAILGALSALVFDILVTISLPLFFITSAEEEFLSVLITAFVFGLPFTITHVISNILLFAMFPSLVGKVYPLLQNGFTEVTAIKNTYFQSHSRNLLLFFTITVLLISTLGLSAYYYQIEREKPKEDLPVEVTVTFDYSNIKESETLTINTTTQTTLFTVLTSIAEIEYSTHSDQHLIESINNVENNRDLPNHYWILYLDSERAGVGVDLIYMEEGVIYSWFYEVYQI